MIQASMVKLAAAAFKYDLQTSTALLQATKDETVPLFCCESARRRLSELQSCFFRVRRAARAAIKSIKTAVAGLV